MMLMSFQNSSTDKGFINMIRVNNLSIYCGSTKLVDNVSFSVKKGETAVLLGRSGSGKSLTSLALMQLLPKNLHSTGEILYSGQTFSETMRGTVLGMIMQSPAGCFDQAFTIGSLFKDIFKTRRKKNDSLFFEKILADVGLENPKDILNSYPFQLSGGMLQRIMIGLCLGLRTEFIIADEPTSDIDCLAEQEILSLLQKTKNQAQSLMIITHNIKTACTAADRILFMHKGRLLDDFPAAEVHSPKRHPILKALLSDNAKICENSWGVKFHD